MCTGSYHTEKEGFERKYGKENSNSFPFGQLERPGMQFLGLCTNVLASVWILRGKKPPEVGSCREQAPKEE